MVLEMEVVPGREYGSAFWVTEMFHILIWVEIAFIQWICALVKIHWVIY